MKEREKMFIIDVMSLYSDVDGIASVQGLSGCFDDYPASHTNSYGYLELAEVPKGISFSGTYVMRVTFSQAGVIYRDKDDAIENYLEFVQRTLDTVTLTYSDAGKSQRLIHVGDKVIVMGPRFPQQYGVIKAIRVAAI